MRRTGCERAGVFKRDGVEGQMGDECREVGRRGRSRILGS